MGPHSRPGPAGKPRAPPRWLPDSYEDLAEALDRLADEPEADHAAAAVDRVDRVGRDEPAAAEKTGANRKRVGHVGGGAVHRSLDPPDDAAARIGDQIPRGRGQ